MSTLKTHNLQSPDAGSVNIALAPNAGMVVTGISTFNNKITKCNRVNTVDKTSILACFKLSTGCNRVHNVI